MTKLQGLFSSPSPGCSRDDAMRDLNREMQKSGVSAQCPDESQLAALAEGHLRRSDRRSLHLHLAECETCLETYSLLCSLLQDTASESRSRRSWTPMALAASLVLVVISVLLLGPHGRDLAPRMESISDNARFNGAESTGPDDKKDVDEAAQESGVPLHAGRKSAVSPPSRKKAESPGQFAPEPDLRPAETPGDGSKGRVERQSRLEQKHGFHAADSQARRPETTRESPIVIVAGDAGEWARDIRIDVRPAGTPAGRVSVMLAISDQGKISGITVKPSDSPLAPIVRQALQVHSFPPAPTPLRHLRLDIEWNGDSWKIHPSMPSNPGESGNGGSTAF